MDLEIANASLLSVNSALERTVRQQSVVIQKLKKQLTRLYNRGVGDVTLDQFSDALRCSPRPFDEKSLDRVCDLVKNLLADGTRAIEGASVIPSQAYDDLDIAAGSGMFYHLPVTHGPSALERVQRAQLLRPDAGSPESEALVPYLDDPYATGHTRSSSTGGRTSNPIAQSHRSSLPVKVADRRSTQPPLANRLSARPIAYALPRVQCPTDDESVVG
ncbi:hypothetical protein HK105_208221 [Polyrhizophydium stewartii]|uniref:Uncharacterized protein n=1 Tax=Polyrhizophydium stewartii TaxID=2732419 RepID=A0ABR4MYG5_9FUNG